ncbi:type II toxin-antitoxin system HicB family antitoxin [Nocardiopsis exhalans]|uniref:Type II toxin-antitoxin system HicB family antitoxin n=1 Tax=Nocardiopsis exhalans TaxID=163604 RepID=A0ABY5D8B4_9ACTN|nr:toxin-antitoxin system HicB family antitoxin [Nocardiopsis exhalans]USY19478.1 type II toxin-antitoxin system HicB family antitoxin [Nocardiopsis exhalans]
MVATGEEPPLPTVERAQSGKSQVRVPPEPHRHLVTEAAEQSVPPTGRRP